MNFKEYYLTEGRNRWVLFTIKMNKIKWSFKNKETDKFFYIKINNENPLISLVNFLKQLEATPPTLPKTVGTINYETFAKTILKNGQSEVFVKSGMWDTIKNTWILGSEEYEF